MLCKYALILSTLMTLADINDLRLSLNGKVIKSTSEDKQLLWLRLKHLPLFAFCSANFSLIKQVCAKEKFERFRNYSWNNREIQSV